MEYLKDSTQYGSFCKNGQADVEHGFSVNKYLIVENMSDESLTAQRFVKDHMNVRSRNLKTCQYLKNYLKV